MYSLHDYVVACKHDLFVLFQACASIFAKFKKYNYIKYQRYWPMVAKTIKTLLFGLDIQDNTL